MSKNLYIPKTIKVGFQKRSDTFTGKLAYIVFVDDTGKTRKEGSWEGWRDHKIPILELDNTPQNGYVFNKGVQRDGHWGSGRSVIRVHDPREFEFEISVENLVGILMHSDVSKRDIVESCVYAWAGKELVLLPTNSEAYQEAMNFTKKQTQKVSAKDIKEGMTLAAKKNENHYVYLGKRDWYELEYYPECTQKNKGKKHVFYNVQSKSFEAKEFPFFSHVIDENCTDTYSSIVDNFFQTVNSQKIVGVEIQKAKSPLIKYHYSYYPDKLGKKISDAEIKMCYIHHGYENNNYQKPIHVISLNGSMEVQEKDNHFYFVEKENRLNHHLYDILKLPDQLTLSKKYDKITQEMCDELYEKFKVGALYWKLENGHLVLNGQTY